MTVLALTLFVIYLLVAFGLRRWLQCRRTGDTGFRGLSGRPGSARWWAGVLFALALVAGFLGPLAGVAGVPPVAWLDAIPLQVLGAVLAVAGVAATARAQLDMGSNWRIGVDDTERTTLVTSGAFTAVRNPVFTAMAATALGLVLMVPNVVAIVGLALLVVALQLQVRVVEEPYLLAVHGDTYTRWPWTTWSARR